MPVLNLNHLRRCSLACSLLLALNFVVPVTASAQSAGALREKYTSLNGQLSKNAYQRPLYLDSAESSNTVGGNVYAVIDAPFASVSTAFSRPEHWCDVMILHLNTKYCKASTGAKPTVLTVHVGKKTAQQLKDAFALEFAFEPIAVTSDYLSVHLDADKGPLGTNHYQIEFQAVALADGKTFMQLRYGYGYGTAGRLAMQAYLSTVASDKVGFTRVDGSTSRDAEFVGGMRGAVERNTMRYYLAIEAYLATLKTPPNDQLQARLERWFDATEQYPRQLHEVSKASYLSMKKDEYARQQAGPAG